MKDKIIVNAKLVAAEKVFDGELRIAGGVIAEFGRRIKRKGSPEIIDAGGKYVMPGFVDIHSNGAAGFDISCGAYDKSTGTFSLSRENYFAALRKALRFYLAAGTTGVVLSSISAPLENLLASFGYIAAYKNSADKFSGVLQGIYVEGSFIKDSVSRGAQNPEYFIRPSAGIINKMQRSADGLVSIVNIPPEWRSGDLIRKLTDAGIICAIGHSSAGGNEFAKAVESGAVLATHFLNGPSSASFKPFGGGGVVEAVLKSDDVFAEIIPDGYHVDKSYVLDVIARKGYEKVIAVTDSMFVVGLRRIKSFEFLGVEGAFGRNRDYIFVKERPNALFGSVLTMDRAFSNLLNWLTGDTGGVWNKKHKALPLDKAIVWASAMCSSNAAELLSRSGRNFNSGKIETGRKADLLIADVVKKKNLLSLKISGRFLAGEPVRL